jgi:polyhydroxyalkanoate synthesis regulator phasin
MDNNDWLRQLMMLGVGTTSLVAEKIREVSQEWVKDGKINPEQAKSFDDDLMSQLNTGSDSVQKQAERQMKNMLQDLGVPRQAEMDELRGRIDRLERQLRDLENKNWR